MGSVPLKEGPRSPVRPSGLDRESSETGGTDSLTHFDNVEEWGGKGISLSSSRPRVEVRVYSEPFSKFFCVAR